MMKKRIVLATIGILIANVSFLQADLITVQLPELERSYGGPRDSTPSTTYDFSRSFTRVDSATLYLEGTASNAPQPPHNIMTTISMGVTLEEVVSPTVSHQMQEVGGGLPFTMDIPLQFDDNVLDGSGDISVRTRIRAAFSEASFRVNTALLTFDAFGIQFDGDFDFDTDVDGVDFLLLQRNSSVGSLDQWQANFGSVGTPQTAATFAVPEPMSVALLLPLFVVRIFGRGNMIYDSLPRIPGCLDRLIT